MFATAGNDHKIFIHRIDEKGYRYVFQGHTDDVQVIRWSPLRSSSSSSSSTNVTNLNSNTNTNTNTDQERYLASIADDGHLIIWKMEYPTSKPRTGSKNSSIGSASPLKRESTIEEGEGDDYQFESTASVHIVHRFVVVGDSENTRMGAVDWGRDLIEGKVLIAA